MDDGTVMDEVRNPMCTEYPKAGMLLHGQPRHPAPPRRHHPVDQRRHAAPVDHPGRRDHRRGRRASASRTCPTWTALHDLRRRRRRLPDLLLHQPAERAADVLPRPLVGHHPPERVRRRGRRLPDHRRHRADADRRRAPSPARDTIPLIVQDRPSCPRRSCTPTLGLTRQDPTWDTARWGGKGNFWYHHVYMPAQNPGDPRGMSAYGRWMYGPWFWPPATGTQVRPDRQPVLRPDLQPRRSRPPGSTRPTRSASPS